MSEKNRFINSIKLKNLLSFGDKNEEVELGSLNVLIGKNTCGKSNLIEAIDLLIEASEKNTAYCNNAFQRNK